MTEWQEQDPGDRAVRAPKPTADFATSSRQRKPVCRSEALDPAAGRRRITDGQHTCHATAIPPVALGDLGRQARLSIDAGQGGLRIRHDRLDLGDKDDPGRHVVAEYVDRTAFAANRERNLDLGDPALGPKPLDERLDKVGVGLIEESIQGLAVPAKPQIEGCVKRFRNASQRSERDRFKAAPLDPRDH